MESISKTYIHLFLLCPLLIYLGISIILQKSNSLLFSYILLLTFLLIMLIHTQDFVQLLEKIINHENLNKSFGYFLIFISIFLIFITIYKSI
jgi:hypothetical protein